MKNDHFEYYRNCCALIFSLSTPISCLHKVNVTTSKDFINYQYGQCLEGACTLFELVNII